jgi:hypothetical protein
MTIPMKGDVKTAKEVNAMSALLRAVRWFDQNCWHIRPSEESDMPSERPIALLRDFHSMSSSIPNTLHSHQCPYCGYIWEHLTLRAAAGVKASRDPAYIEAHRCLGCGAAPTFPFPILSGWRPLPGSW